MKKLSLADKTIFREILSSNDNPYFVNFMLKHLIFAHKLGFSFASNTLNWLADLKIKSQCDPLTKKLFNREAFFQYAEKELAFCSRNNLDAFLIFIDINNLKKVNDNYGHLIGDKLLLSSSEKLDRLTRTSDLVAKIGGDEFIVFIKDETFKNAIKATERIACGLVNIKIRKGKRYCKHYGASIGLAKWDHNEKLEHLLRRADQLMYAAKNKKDKAKCRIAFIQNNKIKYKLIKKKTDNIQN